MFPYQQSLSWMAHWKIQSHLPLHKGLFYFFHDLPLPNEMQAPYDGKSGNFFWL